MTSVFDGMAEIFRDTFGEAMTYTLASGGAAVEITGILEMPALMVADVAQAGIVTADTELHAAVADLPAGHGEGDTVVARGTTWRTKVPMPDGRGMVRIPLARSA